MRALVRRKTQQAADLFWLLPWTHARLFAEVHVARIRDQKGVAVDFDSLRMPAQAGIRCSGRHVGPEVEAESVLIPRQPADARSRIYSPPYCRPEALRYTFQFLDTARRLLNQEVKMRAVSRRPVQHSGSIPDQNRFEAVLMEHSRQ